MNRRDFFKGIGVTLIAIPLLKSLPTVPSKTVNPNNVIPDLVCFRCNKTTKVNGEARTGIHLSCSYCGEGYVLGRALARKTDGDIIRLIERGG